MSNDNKKISLAVVRRLPDTTDICMICCKAALPEYLREIKRKMGVTASQIRQDLNCFGGFVQGLRLHVKSV